jgi:hypothetical protein
MEESPSKKGKIRTFRGKSDQSAIILEDVFPDSDLTFSAPIEFSSNRSGVYLEGNLDHLEMVFEHLCNLTKAIIDEPLFGRWLAVTPPEEDYERTIIHYEALDALNKIHLLNFVLRKHLAKICNLKLSVISTLQVRVMGKLIQQSYIALPKSFVNGEIELDKPKQPTNIIWS